MLIDEHTDQGKVQFQLRCGAKNIPKLNDLGHLLELSAILKDTGVSFSKNVEMRTYGYPPLNEDLEKYWT